MNPFLFTLSFLAIISMLTSSEVCQFQQKAFENHCYKSSCATLTIAEEVRDLSQLSDLREETKKKVEDPTQPDPEDPEALEPPVAFEKKAKNNRIIALGVDAMRPPNNARINFYTLLHHSNPSQEISLYEASARLIRSLYEQAPFAQEIYNFEYRILDKLFEKKAATIAFTSPEELTTIDFEDPPLQTLFYQMLKGSAKFPSLLNYITFDFIELKTNAQTRKINLMFADTLIIRSIFPDNKIAEALINCRDALWSQIAYQELNRRQIPRDQLKGRRAWSTEIKNALKETLLQNGLKPAPYESHLFDCTLGKPGTILFLENPDTHLLSREKYHPPEKKKS